MKNAYKLDGRKAKGHYDWWWHSFVAKNAVTGELKPFFIEYYIVNPSVSPHTVQLGQLPENKNSKKPPSYCMMKVGTWGSNKVQLHNFYPASALHFNQTTELNLTIGANHLSETHLSGSVSVTPKDAAAHPEWMSDAGDLTWDLTVEKIHQYDVGYGSSFLFNALNAFQMYWHVEGLFSKYSGTLVFNGETYLVEPETSFGYQDKNWGSDYTIPWIWLNCNHFISRNTGKPANAFLDIGGGCPVVFGMKLNRRILTAFYFEGELIEFNFSKFWQRSKQTFNCFHDDAFVHWHVSSEKPGFRLEIRFKCRRETMLQVNYENPAGHKHYQNLWNGGFAEGTVELYKKQGDTWTLIDTLDGHFGGCEYGED